LKHKIRFVNIADYPVTKPSELIGFICGIIAQDYDVEGIFIDGLTYILKNKPDELEGFFKDLEFISDKFKANFHISINSAGMAMPEFIKKYV
jgi:hypothetical protein